MSASSHVPLRRAALAICLAGLTACGSTVAGGAGSLATEAEQRPAGGLPGAVDGTSELGDAPTALDGGDEGSTPDGADAAGSSDAGPGGPATTQDGAPSDDGAPGGDGTAAAPQAASQPVGPGITATTVFLGAAYSRDTSTANSALGADKDPGDDRDYYNAVMADLNKRGGVLGRQMKGVYYELQAGSNEPIDSQHQSACDHWTKDNKVFAIAVSGPVPFECARKAGALSLGAGSASGPVYAKYPNLFDPSGMRLERLGQVTVDAMVAQKWHVPGGKWPTGRIGIISWDNRDYRYSMDHGWLPALRRHGLKETDKAYVAIPATVNALGDASAAVSAAVLSFQSQGIDHVLINDGAAGIFRGGGLTFLFLNNAKSQNYYPRYGFNANNSPDDDIYPADQQHGMLAVDYFDIEPENDEGIAPNRHRERCFAIMRAASLAVEDSATRATAASACETVWFLETLLRRASQPTLSGAIRSGEGLGTSFGSPLVYGTKLGPGRHDGAELVRNARFDDACSCMKYTTKPYSP